MLAAAPDESPTVQTPATTLKRDLVRTAALGPAYGLAMGLFMASGFAILHALAGEVSTWSFYVPPVVLFLLGGILMVARFRPSSTYLVTVLVLAARGLVPLRLMAFLRDMHRLGQLRQVGPVYQFRHAKLQDRLAETHRAARMG